MTSGPIAVPETGDQPTHRVVVRHCAGSDCTNPVVTHKVRQNSVGHREYCSLLCYHRWSPAMRAAIANFPHYEQSPRGLERLIDDLRRDVGMNEAATSLGYSRSTVAFWLRKLEAFRQFAGQSPENILALLFLVAQSSSLEDAACLILIDPKTLEQAFKQFKIDDTTVILAA